MIKMLVEKSPLVIRSKKKNLMEVERNMIKNKKPYGSQKKYDQKQKTLWKSTSNSCFSSPRFSCSGFAESVCMLNKV